MDDLIIRRATVDDLEMLVELATAFRDHLRQSMPTSEQFSDGFARLLGDPHTDYLLADRHPQTTVGYAQIRYRYSAWEAGAFAEVEDLFVRTEARRLGIGRRLLAHALQCARARGCRAIGVATNERNAAALALYTAAGLRAERDRWNGGRQLWLERTLDR